MTWLLNKLQRMLGALTGRRRQIHSVDDVSSQLNKTGLGKTGLDKTGLDNTQLGTEIAARLQRSRGADEVTPIAVRDRTTLDEHNQSRLASSSSSFQPSSPQSTAPLRQKHSSVLKDTVDPVAKQPDTHRRLDAAPAAQPGGAPAVPSFPTDVSELISNASTLKDARLKDTNESADFKDSSVSADSSALLNSPATDKNDSARGVGLADASLSKASSSEETFPVPSLEPPADEQLPEIHDLLPAIEPDAAENNARHTAPTIGIPSAEQSAQRPSEQLVAEESDAEVNPSSAFLTALPQEEDVPAAARGSVAASPLEISVSAQSVSAQSVSAQQSAELETANPESDRIEDSHESASEQASEQATLFSFDIIESDSPAAVQDAIAPNPTTQTTDADSSSSIPSDNPWLVAQQRRALEETELTTKSGTVKLLFKLKQGNFHGYIEPEDGSTDILFHQKYINAEIFDELERGSKVVATAKQIAGKAYATRVDLL